MLSVDDTIQLIRIGELPVSTNPSLPGATSVCSTALADEPWVFDSQEPGYGPGASMHDSLPAGSPQQGYLPQEYRQSSKNDLDRRIRAAKAALGDRLVILGHFYQRDEVIQYADFVGDSFQLANAARTRPQAEFIVFCGVHFMAETADMLSRPDQAVVLPNLAAGCSMADMADLDSVTDCWDELEEVFGNASDGSGRQPVVPVTYMNSSAALKGFCGQHGGIVCTSSNATRSPQVGISSWPACPVLPRPAPRPQYRQSDRHPARANAALGSQPPARRQRRTKRCSIPASSSGTAFVRCTSASPSQQIAAARQRFPEVRVIVHPECPMPVVDAADASGSTDYITKAIAAAPAGSTFAIGTEINLVQRLANQYPQHKIFCLDSVVCPCSTMYRIHPSYIAWVLEALTRGQVLNRITVPEQVAVPARVALERMLSLKPGVQN